MRALIFTGGFAKKGCYYRQSGRTVRCTLPYLLNVRHFRLIPGSPLSHSVNPPKFETPLHGACALRVVPTAKLVSRFTSAAFDSDDLAGLDGLEVSEASGHERNEVFQEDGFTTENDHRNQIRDPQSGERRTSRPQLRSRADRSQVPRSQHTGRFDIRAPRDSCAVLRSHTRRGGRAFHAWADSSC